MNGFRDIITQLCTALNLGEPVLSTRLAAIEFEGYAIQITDNGNSLTLSALIGALPGPGPDREEKTRKLLQGSLSILRSHSVLICLKNEKGQELVATELNVPRSEISINKLKDSLNELIVITEAVRNILTGNGWHAHNPFEPGNPVSDSDEMEFVFRA